VSSLYCFWPVAVAIGEGTVRERQQRRKSKRQLKKQGWLCTFSFVWGGARACCFPFVNIQILISIAGNCGEAHEKTGDTMSCLMTLASIRKWIREPV